MNADRCSIAATVMMLIRMPTSLVRRSEESRRRLSAMAGLKRVRPHGLRHSAATTLLDQGCRVQDVQKFGRWATLDMVLTYEDARHDTAGELAGLLARRRQDSKGKPRRP